MPSGGGFLDEENMCGKQLLKIVARGVAIAVELLEISQHIPEVYQTDRRGEYSDLIFDFDYLKKQDELELRIQQSSTLIEKDEEFRETHMEVLHRFYLLFESIWKYITDLLRFWEDIREGFFIQQTFESILVDNEGKQLMAEAIYYYGVMLLLLDMKIEGKVRERMLVSYLRYKGSAGEVANIDDVCRLVRSTGGCGPPGSERQAGPAKKGYPEDYFSRIKVPQDILDMVIGRIRSDDVYQSALHFPAPEHRSASLASQAAMLYVLLYFRPNVMHESKPVMREIADKHFPDNWIITFYLGFTVDLTVAWSGYKAAASAIANTMSSDSLQYYQRENCDRLHKLSRQLKEYLREGVLTEAYVLDHIHSTLLPCLRDCNVTLRWLFLHLTSQDKRIRAVVSQGFEDIQVLMLLLDTSQLEYQLSQMFNHLIKVKGEKWDTCKETAVTKMTKLSQYFGQEGVLAAEVKEESLAQWFEDIAEKIEELEYKNATQAGRKIQGLLTALTEVEEYHQVDENLQVRQFLIDTRALLRTMVRYVNIEGRVQWTMSSIGDFSYGYELINQYVPMMQEHIRRDPSLVMQLRSTFLKLATMLELPCVRMQDARSPDISLVASHFSMRLDKFVRKVLAVIPYSMFRELEKIVQLLTNELQECPTRMPKDMMRERAQLEERYQLAKHTYQISKFTNGILAMEMAWMGIIPLEPHAVLKDGIRKELVYKLARLLHENLQFQVDKKDKRPPSFEERIHTLGKALGGMKQSFEYIQDYANVYGLRIWQEEFSRLIGFNVEMECNRFLTKKILHWQSQFQSEAIPIPRFPSPEGDTSQCNNFMGRLVEQLLDQTDSRRTIYVEQLSAWYDEKGQASVGVHTFTALHSAMDTPGLAGADKLLSFMIVKDLQTLILKLIQRDLSKDMGSVFVEMAKRLSPPSTLPLKVAREQYQLADLPKLKRYWPAFLDITLRVGRCQLLRKHIGKELRFACKLDSPALHASLTELNKALVNDVQAHYKSPMEKLYPNGRKPILPEFSAYLNQCGMNDPFTTIYCATEPVPQISAVLLTFVIAHLTRFQYDAQTDSLVKIRTKQKEPDTIDGAPFAIGVVTVLKQFHSEQKDLFVAYLCQYCRVSLSEVTQMPQKQKDKDKDVVPPEVCNALHFLEIFCRYGSVDKKQVENLLPPFLFAKYKEYSPRVPVKK
eukprot:Hpha_TRINITY_DN12863_c0_g2::TRINITY_DN12863_c0_g2_i1::g.24075::m.24075/K18464/RTSC, SPG8; WASH complex subunit strumpellin